MKTKIGDTRGGKRSGAGRKRIFNQGFKTISIRVQPELKARIEKRCQGKIKSYLVDLVEKDLSQCQQ